VTGGELLFTHYGLSGPIILTLSGPAVARLGQGRLEMSINLSRPSARNDSTHGCGVIWSSLANGPTAICSKSCCRKR